MQSKLFFGEVTKVEKEFNDWLKSRDIKVLQMQTSCSVAILPISQPNRGLGLATNMVQISQTIVFVLTVLYVNETMVDGSPK